MQEPTINRLGGTFYQVIDGFDIPDRVIMDSSPDVIFEGPEASERLEIPNYVLDFPSFVEYLGTDAADHGTDIYTGTRVTDPILEDGTVCGVTCEGQADDSKFFAE